LRVTASFGVAPLPESAGDAEELVAAADSALVQGQEGREEPGGARGTGRRGQLRPSRAAERSVRRASIGFGVMGVLDDAIREHLELKRQHGAPEEELQRQEEEALGPARRDVAPADPAAGDGEVELEAVEAQAAPNEVPASEAPEEETALQEPEDVGPEQQHEAEPPRAEPPAAAPYDAAADIPAFEQEDEAPAEESLEPPRFEVEEEEEEGEDDLLADEHGPEEDEPRKAAGDADVLEDTPDFLQDTPEHDRLWFEQKPPRDFDFD
jgi:hypothetical protein